MTIEEFLINANIGRVKPYDTGDTIFSEGSTPNYYYLIIEGSVKLSNFDEEGKESIHNIAVKGQSVGEFLLFTDRRSPCNAIAIMPCEILRVSSMKFYKLLDGHPELKMAMIRKLSDSLFVAVLMRQMMSIKDPASKLMLLMDFLKTPGQAANFSFQVPITRQQMASITGMRVETTIRTLKLMEKQGLVKIIKRKIFY